MASLTMKASTQEEVFNVRSISSHFCTWVCSVFGTGDLTSTSGRHPRGTGIVSRAILTNNSKVGFSCLVLGILLDSLLFLGGSIVRQDEKISFKVWMYIHVLYTYIYIVDIFRYMFLYIIIEEWKSEMNKIVPFCIKLKM